jgi:hypothetical protein
MALVTIHIPKRPQDIHRIICRDDYAPNNDERLAAFREMPRVMREFHHGNQRVWPWQHWRPGIISPPVPTQQQSLFSL